MRLSMLVLLFFVSTGIAACSSQSTLSGSNGSPDVVDMNGCKVDPASICYYHTISGESITMGGTGLRGDPQMVEQNAPRTASLHYFVDRANGDELFEVECGINTLNRSVSWAHVETGAKVTDDDVKYLRARGYCSQP